MKCDRELLSAYLDGELKGRSLGRLEAHLARCAACRDELERLRAMDRVLDALEKPTAPDGFENRLAARLAGETERVVPIRRLVGVRRVVAAVAAAVVLVAGAALLMNQTSRRVTSTPTGGLAVAKPVEVAANGDLLRDLEVVMALADMTEVEALTVQ